LVKGDIFMGKQYNAREKRARLKRRLKRKKKMLKLLRQQKQAQKEAKIPPQTSGEEAA